jgi:hypothetical protein
MKIPPPFEFIELVTTLQSTGCTIFTTYLNINKICFPYRENLCVSLEPQNRN